MHSNTTGNQDNSIRQAESSRETIGELLDIITSLDEKITELAGELETKTTEMKELQSDFNDYKRTNPEN